MPNPETMLFSPAVILHCQCLQSRPAAVNNNSKYFIIIKKLNNMAKQYGLVIITGHRRRYDLLQKARTVTWQKEKNNYFRRPYCIRPAVQYAEHARIWQNLVMPAPRVKLSGIPLIQCLKMPKMACNCAD